MSQAVALRGLYRIRITTEYWTAGATLGLASLFQPPLTILIQILT